MSLLKSHSLGSQVKRPTKGQYGGVPGHSNQGFTRIGKLILCSVPGCEEPAQGRGLCIRHYRLSRRKQGNDKLSK